MESDDSLPILADLDFIFPTLTPSALEQPAEPVVTLLSPPSISIPSNPASPDEQSDTASTTRDYLRLRGVQLVPSKLTSHKSLLFHLLLETLSPRTYPLAVHEHALDLNNEVGNCNDTLAKTSKKETD